MRILVTCRGLYPNTHPSRVGDFEYLPKHDAYVLDGKPLRVSDANDLFDSDRWKLLIADKGPQIKIQIVGYNDMRKARASSAANQTA